jgi:hypothetical protein
MRYLKLVRVPRKDKKSLKKGILKTISPDWRDKDLIMKEVSLVTATRRLKITAHTLGYRA